jgi:hypothetical protein
VSSSAGDGRREERAATCANVLIRDGRNVKVDKQCRPTSGRWRSIYDGRINRRAGLIDIDHVVPLAEAWRSGAAAWNADQRDRFANDLVDPQLIAVRAASNRSKGDQDPAEDARASASKLNGLTTDLWRVPAGHLRPPDSASRDWLRCYLVKSTDALGALPVGELDALAVG